MAAKETITHKQVIPASPIEIYNVLTNAEAHAAFSGAPASGESKPGGSFSFWGGQVLGKHVDLQPGKRVVQRWKAATWPPGEPPTSLEFTFAEVSGGTEVTMVQSEVPPDLKGHLEKGWHEHY